MRRKGWRLDKPRQMETERVEPNRTELLRRTRNIAALSALPMTRQVSRLWIRSCSPLAGHWHSVATRGIASGQMPVGMCENRVGYPPRYLLPGVQGPLHTMLVNHYH